VPAPAGHDLPSAPGDDPGLVGLLPGQAPPWPVATVEDERGTRWVAHHYVYLGLFRHDEAVAELLRLLEAGRDDPDRAESRVPLDRERSLAEGCLAGFAVDHHGAPIARTYTLASFPWALGRLRERQSLRGFQAASEEAAAAFGRRWRAESSEEPGDAASMSAADLAAEIEEIAGEIGWRPARASVWAAVVRRAWRHETTDASDDDIVNSFYLDDLERVQAAVTGGDVGAALGRFLRRSEGEPHTDIWRDAAAARSAVRPGAVPAARWPAPGLPPQSLMQQAAIDLALERLAPAAGGLFSINGPPGTGKTTLLRDVIAAVVTERARRLVELDRPEDAFSQGDRVTSGSSSRPAWLVRPELRGFEMVVASSINGAVENVTLEIPAIDTIDESVRPRLDYYREVANSMVPPGREHAGVAAWGLIAAVLGNSRNRRLFARGAWFRDPTLREAMATGEAPDWTAARTAFLKALKRERTERDRAAAAASDDEFWSRPDEERQRGLPRTSAEHERARADVFVAAMRLHRALAAARPLRENIAAAIDLVTGRLDPEGSEANGRMVGYLWSSFFLVVPVVSTTFASFARLFRGLGREELGWLFVDEAGQAQPAHAVGALWRARRALVIGDPRQIPPVVTLPVRAYWRLRERAGVDRFWDPAETSVQVIADHANPIGARLHDGTWLGCPLRVHRRCASPMFDISNAIAYDGLMVAATAERRSPVGDLLGPTRWVDVQGRAAEEHWIDEEGEEVATLLDAVLREAFVHGRRPDVFVISPFRSVAARARRLFRQRFRDPRTNRVAPVVADWAEKGIGTIHTFQGKEAEAVVLLLGGNPGRPRALQWAGASPNILNVAVTRAQLRLYVVGSRAAWRTAGYFRELDRRLD
jgi:hypothetical protein